MTVHLRSFRVFLLLPLAILYAMAVAPPAGAATAAEPKFIRVVMDDNYPPYAFRDDEGRLQGIVVDQWRLWERKTGIKVELQGTAWYLALRRMEAGEFDVIDTIFFTQSRAKLFEFSRPYAKLEVPIFFHQDLSGITDAESLRNFSVAVKSGDAAADLLKEKGVRDLRRFLSYQAIIEAAREGQVRVFVIDKAPALHLLYKAGLQDQFKISKPLYVGEFHRAVKKGRQDLLQTIERGFAAVSGAEFRDIEDQWLGAAPFQAVYWNYVAYGLALVLVLVLGLALWNRMLHRKVREKTAQLEREIEISRGREQALKDSEEKFRLFIENFPGLIFIKDSSLHTVMLSRMFEKLLGRPLAEMLGKTSRDLFREIGDKFDRDDRAVLQLPYGEHREFEEAYLDRTYLTWKFPVAHKGEKMICGFTIDITDRKQGEEERRRLEARVQQTQKLESLGMLAGGIAHDFNNLLMAILGNLDLALMDLPPSLPARHNLHEAGQASRRAAELCRQMLAYAGKGRFVVETLDLNRLVKETVHMIGVSLSKKTARRWNLADDLPHVNADPTQLRQVVMNLVLNAAEAIGEREGIITFSTGVVSCTRAVLDSQWSQDPLPEGLYVFFEVADNGCGMPRETLARVFDPFFTTKFAGRGLGLAAVLGIVRSHHGTIQVCSEAGRGSIFRVLLPAASDGEPETPTPSVPATHWRASGTVLLVDDEEGVRTTATHMLERLGFHVITAADGLKALDLYRAEPARFVCVLLDLTMPHLDGEATLREILRIRSDARVILSSGYDEADVSRRFAGRGLAGFMQKPYTLESLASVLRAAMEGGSAFR